MNIATIYSHTAKTQYRKKGKNLPRKGTARPHTVTRLDVIFSYPDRVPLTHFVHRAKKVFAMWAWYFSWILCATGIFRRCNRKVIEHRMGANFDLQIMNQVFYHCATAALYVIRKDIHSIPLLVFPGRFCSYWKPNFPAVSGSYLPGFSGRICSYWQPNFPAVSVVTCRDFLALPLLAPEGRDFPAVSVVSGRKFLAWVL